MVYVSPSASGFFLSLEVMVDLCLINRSSVFFPSELNPTSHDAAMSLRDHVISNVDTSEHVCSCPVRDGTPPRPDVLPYPTAVENIPKMKEWLLDRFSSSTFNTCTRQPLPRMSGPELQIHVDDNAKPKAYHTAAIIPIHWQEQVHSDLLRDERLGVI